MRLTISHEKDGVEYEVVVEYRYDAGKYSGPPENCYEASESINVVEVNRDGVKVDDTFGESDIDAMLEKAREAYEDYCEDHFERELEARNEARREMRDEE